MKRFKMVSYNIMSGCFENYTQDSKLTNRFVLLQQVIKELDADFVGLVDTFKWKETFSEEELKSKFGYKSVFHIDMEDTRVEKNIGITVMTNLDVESFGIIRSHNRNYIETKLNGLYIYTCYLDDLSEDIRILEIKSLLEQIKTPAVIHGDLNTFTKEDLNKFSHIKNEFITSNLELYSKLKPITDEMERCEVVKVIEEKGFVDADKQANATLPTTLFPAKVTKPFVRVDYIFHTKGIQVNNLVVPNTEKINKVSDHYPIIANIN